MYKKMTRAIALLLMFLLLISACSTGTGSQDGSEKILRIGLDAGEPTSLEPARQISNAKRTMQMAMYRGLMLYNIDGSLGFGLAESYDLSTDNLTFTFRLRDAKFHDGSQVTAEDVRFTFERKNDPAVAATFAAELSVIESIATPDDRTVVITLARPFIPFLEYLAMPEMVIVSKAYTESVGGDLSENVMGAGPFKLVQWNRGEKLIVESFDGYYNAANVNLDGIEFFFFSDDDARVNALLAGDTDIQMLIPWRDHTSIENTPGLTLHSGTGPYMGVMFNTTFGPFQDARVRRAISFAVDRQAIINTAFSGRGIELFGFTIPEGYLGYSERLANFFSHDPEMARTLLAEAGYPDGFEVTLLTSAPIQFHMDTAIAIQSELAKIGITVTLDAPDWATRMERVLAEDYEMVVTGTVGDIADPDWLANYYYSHMQNVNKPAGFGDPEVDRLFALGAQEPNRAVRQQIYEEVSERLLELSPAAFFMWRVNGFGVSDRVIGFELPRGFLSHSQMGLALETIDLRVD